MWNAWLGEAQAGINIYGRNINNLRYADDATIMAESRKELKSLLMKVKEESEKAELKFNIQLYKDYIAWRTCLSEPQKPASAEACHVWGILVQWKKDQTGDQTV